MRIFDFFLVYAQEVCCYANFAVVKFLYLNLTVIGIQLGNILVLQIKMCAFLVEFFGTF